MTLKDFHTKEKAVSATVIFKGEGTATALQIQQNGHLKEHITKIPTMLICVNGNVTFENENGIIKSLKSGDYIKIEPMVKHWVNGLEDSQLLLLK